MSVQLIFITPNGNNNAARIAQEAEKLKTHPSMKVTILGCSPTLFPHQAALALRLEWEDEREIESVYHSEVMCRFLAFLLQGWELREKDLAGDGEFLEISNVYSAVIFGFGDFKKVEAHPDSLEDTVATEIVAFWIGPSVLM